MAENKYLLYIDILGFSELAKTNYSKVKKLFAIIDSLNAHSHGDFQSLVFSDTILIFNKTQPISDHDHEYIVMYACEFAQDLIFRCKSFDIQFRAILTYGEFYYEKLKNIEAYHGETLINAYGKEKSIQGLWLYIDKKIAKYNKIFATESFDKNLDFVFLLQDLERAKALGIEQFPVRWELVDPHFLYDFRDEVEILKMIKQNIGKQTDSRIRVKYLQTYELFRNRYPHMLSFLEGADFDFRAVSPDANWDQV